MTEGAFQKQVAHAALIVFLIMMALMALMMAKFKENQLYPPETPPCPDYWINDGDQKCKNIQNLGNGSCDGDKNFSAKKYQGVKGRKERCEYAKKCDIVWDGLTNVKGTC
jgi:hypothetical protein